MAKMREKERKDEEAKQFQLENVCAIHLYVFCYIDVCIYKVKREGETKRELLKEKSKNGMNMGVSCM
jgi:hypothetical protein